MSTSISVSPFGRIPSLGLACALGVAVFCAVADGDEQAAAAPSATARAARSMGLFNDQGILPQRPKDTDVKRSSFFDLSLCVSRVSVARLLCLLSVLYQSNFAPNLARRVGRSWTASGRSTPSSS